jgi:hypothetical protein
VTVKAGLQILSETNFDPAGPTVGNEQREDFTDSLTTSDRFAVRGVRNVLGQAHLDASFGHGSHPP